MSQPRAHASPNDAAALRDADSGVHRIGSLIAEARRAWEEEDRRDEAAEIATFEWRLFLNDLAPAPAPENDAASTVAAPAERRDPLAPTAAEVQAWIDGQPRRARVRSVGRALVAGAFAGMLAIAATPAGSDAIASWLTLGHQAQARAHVADTIHRAGR